MSIRDEMYSKYPGTKGLRLLVEHLEGKRLTRGEAAIAKCCDCMAYYVDGRKDCLQKQCPLYPYMPYRKK